MHRYAGSPGSPVHVVRDAKQLVWQSYLVAHVPKNGRLDGLSEHGSGETVWTVQGLAYTFILHVAEAVQSRQLFSITSNAAEMVATPQRWGCFGWQNPPAIALPLLAALALSSSAWRQQTERQRCEQELMPGPNPARSAQHHEPSQGAAKFKWEDSTCPQIEQERL